MTLVLLVVFMITARGRAEHRLSMDVPKQGHAEATAQTVLSVSLDEIGKISVDGRPIATVELQRAVHEAHARDARLRAVVSAPASAHHGAIIHIVDTLHAEGIAPIAFARRSP